MKKTLKKNVLKIVQNEVKNLTLDQMEVYKRHEKEFIQNILDFIDYDNEKALSFEELEVLYRLWIREGLNLLLNEGEI
jgi:hypothetical protein